MKGKEMTNNEMKILLEFEDEKYGKVKLALSKDLKEVCIIGDKIEEDSDIIYDIKFRNHLCRDKRYNHILD